METVISFLTDYRNILWAIIILTYLGLLVTILFENRNPAKSIAYIMVLVFIPGLGLLIYYLFGRDLRKQHVFKKKAVKDVDIAKTYLDGHMNRSEDELDKLRSEIGDLVQPFKQLYLQKLSLVHGNNRTTLLNNGEEKFPTLFTDLLNARHHIHIEYYILSKDDVGNRLTDILLQKLSEGVKVRIIMDGQGSRKGKALPRILKAHGAEVYIFMPVRFSSLAMANYRNHRKIVIIDGWIGYVGGINLDDRYLNNGKHELFWRDTHLRITGPAVKELQFHFFRSLGFTSKRSYELEPVYFPKPLDEYHGDAAISIVASGPDSPFPHNMEILVNAILQARKSIRIANPYFIPSDQIMSALGIAAASGVEVELILPQKSDNFIVGHSSFSYLKPLLKRGVHIYLYKAGFIHSKTTLIDNEIAFVGSTNMDIRSFYINFEITALVRDRELCRQMNKAFEGDRGNSVKISKEQWMKRPVTDRALDSVCRLLTPLL